MTMIDLTRRSFLRSSAVLSAALVLPLRAFADSHGALKDAVAKSPLVYISPLKSDGAESSCHGEVWFVADGEDLLVVTNPERWRAACLSKGLDQARIWVGDFGLWKRSSGAFRGAPSYIAKASVEPDPAVHASALEAFGKRFSAPPAVGMGPRAAWRNPLGAVHSRAVVDCQGMPGTEYRGTAAWLLRKLAPGRRWGAGSSWHPWVLGKSRKTL